MSSNMLRIGKLAGLAILLSGAIALAQNQAAAQPTAQGHVDVFNPISGRIVINASRPNGAQVEKGDVVCELDPREIEDRRKKQELVVRATELEVEGATMTREAAEMKIVEYREGQFRNELAEIGTETKLAEANLARAEDQLEWSRRMFEKGYVSMAEKVTNELLLREARFKLEVTQSKRKVLLDYTRERALKELKSDAATAKSRELAKQAALEWERSVLKSLSDQIGRCKIMAPTSGRIEYATPIGTGAVVHDGQLMFRVVPGVRADSKAR
jgi:multidrug resistance efflux pump